MKIRENRLLNATNSSQTLRKGTFGRIREPRAVSEPVVLEEEVLVEPAPHEMLEELSDRPWNVCFSAQTHAKHMRKASKSHESKRFCMVLPSHPSATPVLQLDAQAPCRLHGTAWKRRRAPGRLPQALVEVPREPLQVAGEEHDPELQLIFRLDELPGASKGQ